MSPDFPDENFVYHHTPERVSPDFPDENFVNHLKQYQFAAQFARGKDVLDVGSGTGYGAAYLKGHGAKSVTGIDNSAEAVGFAKRRYGKDKIDFLQMDAHNIQLHDQSVDLVTSFESLEHLARPAENLAEIKRVLRADGMLVLSTPNKEIFSPDKDRPDNPFHFYEFSFEELHGLLTAQFGHVYLFETRLESPFETGRAMKRKRQERGCVGLDGTSGSTITIEGRLIHLEHLHNTHSFMALAWA